MRLVRVCDRVRPRRATSPVGRRPRRGATRKNMDFSAALSILQERSARPYEGTRPPVSGDAVTTATTGEAPVLCSECSEQPFALPSELATLSTARLIRLFLARQEERVNVYRRFEEGFALFLQVAEAEGYDALVKSITQTFASISAAVNDIEVELKARGPSGMLLATILRRVQTLEREKLELTARSHILRHGLAVDELHADGVGVDGPTAAAAARTAPLRAQEKGEVEARLDALRGQLNEALDELRCELCDLVEDEEASNAEDTAATVAVGGAGGEPMAVDAS